MSTAQQDKFPNNIERVVIGVIVAPHGITGEVRMHIWTHFPERIPELDHVFLEGEEQPRPLRSAHLKGGVAVLRLDGIDTRDAAESLRGVAVRIGRDQVAPLEEGEYFHFQLIGLKAYDQSGNYLGELAEIIETGANDVYVLRDEAGRETLVPALQDVIPEVDLERGRMTVRLLEFYED